MEFIELYAEYGAVGVVVILFAITFIKQSKVTETQAEALNSLQIENEGQSKNIESILLKFLDRWNRSDETRDRRHEDLVKEVNDMSDVLMEVKGSVSRINGSR